MTNTEHYHNNMPDWERLRQRLQKEQQLLDAAWEPDPAESLEILRSRGQVLATKPQDVEEAGERIEVITFLLAGETYALESGYVDEVFALHKFTPIPFTPEFVLGVISRRSQIISLIDLRDFFDFPPRGRGDLNKVLILRSDAMIFGILAEGITGTSQISVNSLQKSVHTITDARESYILGITPDRVMVIDGEQLLNDRRIVVSDTIITEPEA